MRKSPNRRLVALVLGGKTYPLTPEGKHAVPLASVRRRDIKVRPPPIPPPTPVYASRAVSSAVPADPHRPAAPAMAYPDFDHEYELPPVDFSFTREEPDLAILCREAWTPDQMGFDLDLYGIFNQELS
jgi:hypothetical protein